MLRFELDVVAADLRSRTIEGVAMPYGEVGTIQGRHYRFAPGSLTLARSRPPLLVDHDRGRPVGVLEELVEGDGHALARFTIDATQDGDTALVQAASGSRGSLSVGAELVEATEGAGGVVDVARAIVHEVSLLALGAFPSATVTRVAAEADEPDDEHDDDEPATPADPDQTELDLDDDDELDELDDDDDEEAGAAGDPDSPEGTTMTEASAAPVILAGADRASRPQLLAGELVILMIRAQRGESEGRRLLEAALTESISTDVAGLLPPSYERTVIGGKDVPRPLFEAFRSRPLPGVGLAVNKPKWTTPPDGAWASSVDADATSTKVVIGSQPATVERWDWAGAFPWVVVQRSAPDLIDSVYAEAVQDFYLDVEAKVAAELAGATAGAATTLGAAIAEFYAANSRTPDVILMAPDVWGAFADAGVLAVSIGTGGVSTSDGLSTTFAGIRAIAAGSLAAGSVILATRRAVDARITEPVRLTANAIGALNVELAVVGEGLFDTDYPAELMAFSSVTPTPTVAGSRRS